METKNKQQNIHFKGYESFLSRIDDLVYQASKYGKNTITPFLTLAQQEVVLRYVGKKIEIRQIGGYANAEKKRFVFVGNPYDHEEVVSHLMATYHPTYGELSHRDVLGALMKLGLEREQFGDIIVYEDKLHIYCASTLNEYIRNECTRIGRQSIILEISEEVVEHTTQYEMMELIVSSLRLDVLVGALSGLSRKKAQEIIRKGDVKLNDHVLEESSNMCNNGDTISIRRYGKYRLFEVLKQTRKERLVVLFGKYQ